MATAPKKKVSAPKAVPKIAGEAALKVATASAPKTMAKAVPKTVAVKVEPAKIAPAKAAPAAKAVPAAKAIAAAKAPTVEAAVVEPVAAPVVETASEPKVAPVVAPVIEAVAEPVAVPVPEIAPVAAIADAITEIVTPQTETAAAAPPPVAKLEGYMMTDVIETGKKFAEDAKIKMETMTADFNAKAKAAMEKSGKMFEEMGDIAKGNVEAMIESSKIAAKGAETMGQGAAEYGRAQFEKTSATLKSFASVKSPAEFFQLQSQLLTGMFDSMASETAKSSEAMMKLAGEVAQPLSSRASLVTEKVKALAA